MIKEYQLVESRLDATHPFSGDAFRCAQCGQPRGLHRYDNFTPSTIPSKLGTDQKAAYRGPHPFWSRPGSYSKVELGELSAEQKAERLRIERAIQKDKEQFQQRQASRQ